MRITVGSFTLGLLLLGLALALPRVVSQDDVAEHALPAPIYTDADVQYFPPGPEFDVADEAAVNVGSGWTAPKWR